MRGKIGTESARENWSKNGRKCRGKSLGGSRNSQSAPIAVCFTLSPKIGGSGDRFQSMFTGTAVVTGVTRVVVTHLLEGRDGLPALWHSRDESGRGGRVVVLPRLLDELAHGDQARHLSARSRFPSVVPSPAVHPALRPPAASEAVPSARRIASRHRDSPSLVLVVVRRRRRRRRRSRALFTLRGHRSLHLSLTMNSAWDTPVTFSVSPAPLSARYERRPGAKSDRKRESVCVKERGRERKRERQREE